MDAGKLKELKLFVQQVEANPALLQDPELRFFRNYLEKLGANLPSVAFGKESAPKASFVDDEDSEDDVPDLEEKAMPMPKPFEGGNVTDDESDVELDIEGVVQPDDEAPQKMGDQSVEVTEEKQDEAQIAKGKAVEAMANGKVEEALELFTEAIVCNPHSAILFGNRAGVYVKMKKPNAAIRDADAAIKINPDSARGYKWRGEAHALLGNWEQAAKDLHLASQLDYDEEIAAALKKVELNVHKIEEHRRKYTRLRKERDEKKAAYEREVRRAEAQAAYDRAKKKEQERAPPRGAPRPGGMPGFPGGMPAGMGGGFPGGMPGGMGGMPGGMGGMPGGMGGMPGGMGGMPGGMGGMPGGMGGGFPGSGPGGAPGGIDMSKILSDPELMSAFSDPEVMAALQDVMKNPGNLSKHQSNPKVAPTIAKMLSKFGGGAAM